MKKSRFRNSIACIFTNVAMAMATRIMFAGLVASAQESHDHMKGMEMPTKHLEKMPPESALKPAEGASVKILTPTKGQIFKGDKVPLQFKLVKGKKGHHVHAYVDGELMGMFESEKGTINGVKPGMRTLKLRVVAADHQTDLDASDEVSFMVK